MAIRIESLTVENLRRFRGKHRLDLDQTGESTINVIAGSNGSGKTTLSNSIQLCLTGEFDDGAPLVNYDYVDQLVPGGDISANISLVITDNELNRRFRFSRNLTTSETRRGPINSVGPLEIEEEKAGEWVSADSAMTVNTVFPQPAFTFCSIDTESSLGFTDNWGGTSWDDLVEDVNESAVRQAAARGINLPEYFANEYELRDEMLRRINDKLANIDARYRVEERNEGLVGRMPDDQSSGVVRSLPAGEVILISQITALVAGGLMPVSPPLIGDTMFGRLDLQTRKTMSDILQDLDRQILLFAIGPELEGLEFKPRFRLLMRKDEMSSEIISVN